MPPARTPEHWSARYIGLPYAQCDCAALCEQVLREVFGREVHLPTDRAGSVFGLSRQIDNLQATYATPVERPHDGDAVLMRSRGRLNHIGLVCLIDGRIWVLHSQRNAGMVVLHREHALGNLGLQRVGYYAWK